MDIDFRFLSNKEAADLIGRTPGWLNKARCYGNGPPFHRIGRRIFYRLPDLRKWVDENRHNSTSEY